MGMILDSYLRVVDVKDIIFQSAYHISLVQWVIVSTIYLSFTSL